MAVMYNVCTKCTCIHGNLWKNGIRCVYKYILMPSTLCLIERFNYFIERFDYFLVCSVIINAVIPWMSEQEIGWSQAIATAFLQHKAYFHLNWYTANTVIHSICTHTHKNMRMQTCTQRHARTHTYTHSHMTQWLSIHFYPPNEVPTLLNLTPNFFFFPTPSHQ